MKGHLALIVLATLTSSAFAGHGDNLYYDRIDVESGVQYVASENGKYLETYDTDNGTYIYSQRLSKEWLLGPTIKEAASQEISSNVEYCELQGDYHPPKMQDVKYLLSSLRRGDVMAMRIIQDLGWDQIGAENLKFTSALFNNETPQSSWRIVWFYDLDVGENNAEYSIFTSDTDIKTHYSCAPNL